MDTHRPFPPSEPGLPHGQAPGPDLRGPRGLDDVRDIPIGDVRDERDLQDLADQDIIPEARTTDDFVLRRKPSPAVYVGGGLLLVAAVVGMDFALDAHPARAPAPGQAATVAPVDHGAGTAGAATAAATPGADDRIGSLERNPPAAGAASMPSPPAADLATPVAPPAPATVAAPSAKAPQPRAPRVKRAPLRVNGDTPPADTTTPAPAPAPVVAPPAVEPPQRAITEPPPPYLPPAPSPSPSTIPTPDQTPAPPALSPDQPPSTPGT